MSIADIINGTSGTGASSGSGVKKKDQLGQTEFLELMIAQLKNQDPFKAMDPSQFLGQLAQFGTVSGIQDMQSAFSTFADSMRSAQVLEGATMVGREVLVEGEEAALGVEGSIRGAVDVPTGVTALQVNVLDSAGQLVRRMSLPTSAGLTDFSWDGTLDNGARAPAGEYAFEVLASVGGENTSLQPMLSARVDSVTVDNRSGLVLNTSTLGARTLNEVRRVM
jgi:flagellar basal-body rod modification protein FlgD